MIVFQYPNFLADEHLLDNDVVLMVARDVEDRVSKQHIIRLIYNVVAVALLVYYVLYYCIFRAIVVPCSRRYPLFI